MVHTRWTVPNIEHEKALVDFVPAILEDSPENKFLHDFQRFASKVAFHGALNSLSQLVLKLASPGVADFFQGSELWDLRLVDPDNRGPVDFKSREEMLTQVRDISSLPQLKSSWRDGRIKMEVTRRGLHLRRSHPSVFLKGEYIPLQVEGQQRDCVIAIARRYRGDWCAAIVPRFTTRLLAGGEEFSWEWLDTRIVLPKEAPVPWENVFNSASDSTKSTDRTLMIRDLLRDFPVAMIASV